MWGVGYADASRCGTRSLVSMVGMIIEEYLKLERAMNSVWRIDRRIKISNYSQSYIKSINFIFVMAYTLIYDLKL